MDMPGSDSFDIDDLGPETLHNTTYDGTTSESAMTIESAAKHHHQHRNWNALVKSDES